MITPQKGSVNQVFNVRALCSFHLQITMIVPFALAAQLADKSGLGQGGGHLSLLLITLKISKFSLLSRWEFEC